MKTKCQVCTKEIKGAKYFDKTRRAYECAECYVSKNSRIKNEKKK